ncbi:MAG: sigma-70 family RNA polymerase sigma factor [Ignavibacteriae bacterium]|jgi:RNA polymerase sigma-70 factor, ECF subfamily|nr:MAG: sigma-70 family RNA polymerase sigma factor [Ignavibacteriota bacterium]
MSHPIEQRRRTFEEEAVPHLSALYNYAVRMTRDRDDAADLVQDTFMKAFRFFDSFEQGTNCKAWLFRILKNTYINTYRKTSKGPDTVEYDVVEEFYDTIKDSSVETSTLEQQLFEQALDDQVSDAIQRLPDDFRTVIILCDIEGFTYEEIAEFIDCPIGTVRSRLHRARKILAATLADYARERGFSVDGMGSTAGGRP